MANRFALYYSHQKHLTGIYNVYRTIRYRICFKHLHAGNMSSSYEAAEGIWVLPEAIEKAVEVQLALFIFSLVRGSKMLAHTKHMLAHTKHMLAHTKAASHPFSPPMAAHQLPPYTVACPVAF